MLQFFSLRLDFPVFSSYATFVGKYWVLVFEFHRHQSTTTRETNGSTRGIELRSSRAQRFCSLSSRYISAFFLF